jgi:hypothetical protein
MTFAADFRTPELTSDTTRGSRALTVRLAGTAERTAIAHLQRLWTGVHGAAMADAVDEVVVDLADLEFMTSSCLKTIVDWVSVVRDAATKYKIRFEPSSVHSWQKRSLPAIACFAVDLIVIGTARTG